MIAGARTGTGPEAIQPVAMRMPPSLWLMLPVAIVGIYATWGGLMGMIVARQIAELVPDTRRSVATLGIVMTMGATIALFAQPLLGALSDRTPVTRFGRRNVWILGGTVSASTCLILMASNRSVPLLAALFAAVVFCLSAAHAALATVLPERVPTALQGRMSGILGAATMLGYLLGVSATGLASSTARGYVALAAILVVTCGAFALIAHEPRQHAVPPSTRRGLLRAMVGDIPGWHDHRDFWLTFASRFSLLLAYNIIVGFNFFLLKDYIGIGHGNTAIVSREVAKIMTVSTSLILLFSIVGGLWCDASRMVKLPVIASALLLVPAAAIFAAVPSITGFYVGHVVLGSAFGIYMAVDTVLIARVLPGTSHAARDLGVLNVANSGPQALAPILAGVIIAATANYTLLFTVMAILAILAAAIAHRVTTVD